MTLVHFIDAGCNKPALAVEVQCKFVVIAVQVQRKLEVIRVPPELLRAPLG